jgi:murein DD-endopeptidase MepM/ murein hydrolase activator NlpD
MRPYHYLFVSLLLLGGAPLYSSESGSVCPSGFSSPLKRRIMVSSPFDIKKRHYGVDYRSDGDEVLAVKDGIVVAVRSDLHAIKQTSSRTGLRVQGFGTYVVVAHSDGSQSLYAHLVPSSVSSIKSGQRIKAGEKVGVSDSSGAVTGPHLHFQFSPSGKLFSHEATVDPDPCVLRSDWLTLESYPVEANGVGQLYVAGQLIGENVPHQKARFVLRLKPGKYPIRIEAKQVSHYRAAYFSSEMGEAFTILNAQGADLGPVIAEKIEQGKEFSTTLKVE